MVIHYERKDLKEGKLKTNVTTRDFGEIMNCNHLRLVVPYPVADLEPESDDPKVLPDADPEEP